MGKEEPLGMISNEIGMVVTLKSSCDRYKTKGPCVVAANYGKPEYAEDGDEIDLVLKKRNGGEWNVVQIMFPPFGWKEDG